MGATRLSMRDDEAMAAAIEAAHEARRRVAPWPHVGAAVVRDGELIGVGTTGAFPDGPHAEVVALRAAGAAARGSTVFTTLEPCNHHGNTPPCTEALIDAGVARVVTALEDPDPKVSGTGFARLRARGMDVSVGVGANLAAEQLHAYLLHRRTGRSSCVVKVATSIDGRIAAADGSSRWITGAAARADAHGLRADSQAIVVGAGTALADDPALTVRDASGPEIVRQPLRVLLDARGRVAPSGHLADPSLAPTLVVVTDRVAPSFVDAWRAVGAQVECVDFVAGPRGSGVDLHAVFALLGARGVLQTMVEGGAHLHGALFDAALVDRLVVYVGNTMLGRDGLTAFGVAGPPSIADAPRFRLRHVQPLGDDVRLDYAPREEGRCSPE
jgi:diaminohydroxyphosphoribosylaminopyrimidine deaminase/5-amino-6-(5-phosphoribosylamino)uracil reductase